MRLFCWVQPLQPRSQGYAMPDSSSVFKLDIESAGIVRRNCARGRAWRRRLRSSAGTERNPAVAGRARGPDHADGANDLAVDLVRRAHHAHVVRGAHARLAADEDLHALSAQRQVEDLDERALALEQLEQLLQARHVLRQLLHREQVALARDDVLLVALSDRLVAGLERDREEANHVVLDLAQLAVQALAHVLEALPGVVLVHEVRRLDQLRRHELALGEEDAVLHVALGGDHDQEDALLRKAQKLDVAERERPAPRRHDHARELRELGKELRGGGHHALRVVRMQLGLELLQLARLELLHDEQGVDEEAIAERRRHAAGRRVGARDEAHLLEIGHRVADRGGRKNEPRIVRRRARADRLAFGNVALDQGLEQDLGALVEHGSLYTRAHGSPRNARGTSAGN